MKTRKISIAAQLFLFILGAAMIVALVVGCVSYSTMENFLRQKSMNDVMEIAVIAAENVDAETFLSAVEGDAKALETVKNSLSFFLAGDSVTYVYTLMPKDTDNFQFVVDTDPEDPGEYAEDYAAQDAMFEAMQGKPSVTKEAFTDEWGTFYSGYAPILHKGKTLGIIAVDYEASSIRTSLNSLIRNLLAAVTIGIFFAVSAALLAAVRMKRNFKKVNDKIIEVVSSDGDLTKVLDITSGDELEIIAMSLNKLLQKTGNTVREIKNGADNIELKMEDINTHVSDSVSRIGAISGTIHSMVTSSGEIALSAQTVGEQVDFVYKDIQDIVKIVTDNTTDLKEINDSSEELTDTARISSDRVEENVEAMSIRFDREKEKANAVLRIKELSDAILSISGQTNLLALNASIEAARAGDAGKGFSIVAEEIGALAGDTNNAANEIRKMSDGVVDAIQGLDMIAEQMLLFLQKEVSQDYKKFGNASQNFTDKSETIRTSMERLQQITHQYAKSLEQIKNAMQSVSAISEENSAEITNVSQLLSSIDTDMKNIEKSTEETVLAVSVMNKDLSSYRI